MRYCGMLNASYNLKLRNIRAYIPEYPVGTAEECADMIHEFEPIARAVVALSNLKIISFGLETVKFPCLQRTDKAALQSGCGD